MSGMHLPTPASYKFIVEPHKRALETIQLELDFFLRDIGDLNLFSVSGRIKQYERALGKANLLHLSVSDLDDLAGLRIVVGTQAEVPIITRFFTRQEVSKSLKVLKTRQITRDSGYRATHLIIEKSSSYHSSVFPGRVEVQIHTIFQHAFNFLSRNWSYKQPWHVSQTWSAKFAELSRLLSEIDAQAEQLHIGQAQMHEAVDAVELTPYSVQLIVKAEFDEIISIEDAVDSCRMYVDLGCKTNADLRLHFHDTRVGDLYQTVQAKAVATGQAGPISNLTRYSFWSIFGTRIGSPGLKEFFAALSHDI